MWNEIRTNWPQWTLMALIGLGIGLTMVSFRNNDELESFKAELRAELQSQQSVRPLIDMEPVQQFLSQFTQSAQAKPKQLEELPASTTAAIARMSEDINRLAKLVEQNRELNSLLVSNGGNHVMKSPYPADAKVDRNGNTEEALNDIYSPVNIPIVQDAMAKGLARHPGSRVVIHPESGVPVLANYEWVSSHGGRVQELKRANGIERPISIHYSAPTPKPEAKPEPFRLNLGNN